MINFFLYCIKKMKFSSSPKGRIYTEKIWKSEEFVWKCEGFIKNNEEIYME